MWRKTKRESCLYSAVAPVGHDDVPVGVHGHSGGSVELAVAFAVGAKLEQELSVCVVDLGRDITPDERKPTWRPPTETLSLHLHGVIVEICHDYFVLVVHCNKVGAWKRREERLILE